ncbi:putative deoxyribonuclease tatdn3, partial [Gonapodya sp. JEL0774]
SGIYSELWPCAGLHPVQRDLLFGDSADMSRDRTARLSDVPPVVDFIREHHESLIAVGEIGLDFTPHVLHPGLTAGDVRRLKKDSATKVAVETREFETREEQKEVFRRLVRCALEYGLPVNCHSRSAGRYTIEVLREMNVQSAILHAFDGSVPNALSAASLGYFLSVPPSVVRSPQMQSLVDALPLTNILLETDSPALAPDPGGRNEPSKLVVSLEEVAKRKGFSSEEVSALALENARKVFSDLDTKWLKTNLHP